MSLVLKNNATSKLAGAITSGALTLSVQTGEGARFPVNAGADWFPITMLKADGTFEIARCTLRSGDVLTILRAQENTAALAFSAGDRIESRFTLACITYMTGLSTAAQTDADDAQARCAVIEAATVPLAAKAVQFDAMTGAAKIPLGTTAQRGTVEPGDFRLNTETNQWEGSKDGVTWGAIGGGATGGGTNAAFLECDAFITDNYTIGQQALLPCTISIATPCVITQPNMMIADQPVHLETTGALPTGLLRDTVYYVLATGLTATTYRLSLTPGGAAINTSGSQSGIQSSGVLRNAVSPGTIAIATGKTVTVPNGVTLSIV